MIDDQAETTLTFLLCLESFQGWRVAALVGLAFFKCYSIPTGNDSSINDGEFLIVVRL